MIKLISTVCLQMMFCAISFTQPTQNISGRVVDLESQISLPGVRVTIIDDTSGVFKVGTDLNGKFLLKDVPVGRHSLAFTLIGYGTFQTEIILTSGKEIILTVELEESIEDMKTLVVKSQENRGEAGNEMATVSARRFSVEETNRYAGSRGDPARMASNYAGVQGADDSRNDIVVRGNSPLGVIYQIEGITTPNPNHFSVSGSQGGPATILNNKVLSNGDFFTSAFPAEYGNSLSAVFDLGLRNGNTRTYEFSGQFGVLGMELTAEGPINKKKNSSFIANYRYSTIGLFQTLGIDVGTDAIPTYSDAAFKLSFPLKNGGHLSFFGVGGKSAIDIKISDQIVPSSELYGVNDKDQYFKTKMGFSGVRYTKSINKKSFFSMTLATSYEEQNSIHNFVDRYIDSTTNKFVVDSIYQAFGYTFKQTRLNSAVNFTTKINRRNVIKYGFQAELIFYNFLDSLRDPSKTFFFNRWDAKGTTFLVQPYIQWKHKASENLVITAGIHTLYFEQSKSLSAFEPRLGLKYKLGKQRTLSAGLGLHSQIQPFYTYYYHLLDQNENKVYHNGSMGLTKSFHSVLGYNKRYKNNLSIRMEGFYQYLYQIPVELKSSAFSLVNLGSGFARFYPDTLVNKGTGENFGIEFTAEKFFDNDFFFMLTTSLYSSTYKGSDGIKRNTDYNGIYAANLLVGKEFKIKEKNVLSIGTKITIAGGKRYGLVDEVESKKQDALVFQDDQYNAFQFDDYFRTDLKINYTINAKKVSHEIGLDLINITNQQNILGLTYTPDQPDGEDFRENYQLGFLPIFFYRIDF